MATKQRLNPTVQTAIYGGLAIGAAVGLYFAIDAIKKAAARRRAAQQLNNIQGELNALGSVSNQKPTLPLSQFDTLANTLYTAMASSWYNPFSWGTTETDIISVFQTINNNADYLALQKAFGVKDGYTLDQWLTDDLSDSPDVKAQINSILTSKGIIYRI
jgi:hypothetical protein